MQSLGLQAKLKGGRAGLDPARHQALDVLRYSTPCEGDLVGAADFQRFEYFHRLLHSDRRELFSAVSSS